MKPFMNEITLVAETAFSHDGDLSYLKKQVEDAAKCGVDFVKFQILLDPEQYFIAGHSAFDQISGMIFSSHEWDEVMALADSFGLKIMVLPLETTALRFCLERKSRIQAFELHSVCFYDYQLLQMLKEWPGTMIIGIGGRRLSEVMKLLEEMPGNHGHVVLMAGFQSFPTRLADLELAKLAHFARATECIMGYADHTACNDVGFHQLNAFAYLLGARWFEKHLVVKAGEPRTDYESAIDWREFQRIKDHFQELFACLGTGDPEKLNDREMTYREREKYLVAAKPLAPGDVFTSTNMTFRVASQKGGLGGDRFSEVVGCQSSRAINKGEMIHSQDVKWT